MTKTKVAPFYLGHGVYSETQLFAEYNCFIRVIDSENRPRIGNAYLTHSCLLKDEDPPVYDTIEEFNVDSKAEYTA